MTVPERGATPAFADDLPFVPYFTPFFGVRKLSGETASKL